jgi:chemotaxis protein MotB
MKKRGDQGGEVIIKRRSKKQAHEAHGGAWKVAFADFTLAMMALFMVLWVIQPMKEAELADASPLVDGSVGVFDGTSTTPLDLDGVQLAPVPVQTTGQAADGSADSAPTRKRYAQAEDMQELAELLKVLAEQTDANANLQVDIVPQGLRVLIKDDQQRDMFSRGSAQLQPHFRTLLAGLAATLAKVDNKLIISGHTDSTAYPQNAGYDNWNLSGDRALSARRAMVAAGLPLSAVLQVAAQADTMPLASDAPQDGANRRIELLLLTDRAEQLYRALFDSRNARAAVSEQGASFQPSGS